MSHHAFVITVPHYRTKSALIFFHTHIYIYDNAIKKLNEKSNELGEVSAFVVNTCFRQHLEVVGYCFKLKVALRCQRQ